MAKDLPKTTENKLERFILININVLKQQKMFLMEGWMMILDNICLAKSKQSKECFRKKIVKFYKHYLPEFSDFRDILNFPELKDLPNRKNYLYRVCKAKLFYVNVVKLNMDSMLGERESEAIDEFYDIIFIFKRLVRDMLSTTYNFLFSESLIITDPRIQEFIYQLLKYLEIEFLYATMAFKLQDKSYFMQKLVCIFRRYYLFWIDLLAEIYSITTDPKGSDVQQKEMKYLRENSNLEKRIRKFQNFHNLSRKQKFFHQNQCLYREEPQKKMKFEYDVIMREFTFNEMLLQDDFADKSFYGSNESSGQFRPTLSIDDIIPYYQFLDEKISKPNEIPLKKIDYQEGATFIKNINMLIELNINLFHEFLYAEYTDWYYYEELYLFVIQLYSFLKRYYQRQSIVEAIIQTYTHFQPIDSCNLRYADLDEINIHKDPIKKDEKITKSNAAVIRKDNEPRKPWWWRKLGAQASKDDDSDDEFEYFGGENEKNLDRESKAVELFVNKILRGNSRQLLILIQKYFSKELDGERLINLNPQFLFDGVHFQKNETFLDDALAFDLSIIISYLHWRFDTQEYSDFFGFGSITNTGNSMINKSITRSDSLTSPTNSLRNMQSTIKDDDQPGSVHMQGMNNNSDQQTDLDNSLDQDDEYQDKMHDDQRSFCSDAFKTEIQSRRYIMPLDYRKLTLPTPQDIILKIHLTDFKPEIQQADSFLENLTNAQSKQNLGQAVAQQFNKAGDNNALKINNGNQKNQVGSNSGSNNGSQLLNNRERTATEIRTGVSRVRQQQNFPDDEELIDIGQLENTIIAIKSKIPFKQSNPKTNLLFDQLENTDSIRKP